MALPSFGANVAPSLHGGILGLNVPPRSSARHLSFHLRRTGRGSWRGNLRGRRCDVPLPPPPPICAALATAPILVAATLRPHSCLNRRQRRGRLTDWRRPRRRHPQPSYNLPRRPPLTPRCKTVGQHLNVAATLRRHLGSSTPPSSAKLSTHAGNLQPIGNEFLRNVMFFRDLGDRQPLPHRDYKRLAW